MGPALFKNHKAILVALIVNAIVLVVPLVAMQFTDEVDWSVGDFIVATLLIMGSGLIIDFVSGRSRNAAFRLGVVMAVGTGLLLIWVNLAVGLIGDEDNPANLMYSTVILIGLVGGTASGFKPRGMAYALYATALAQMAVPFIALTIWQPPFDDGVFKVIVLNTNFAILFIGSAILFHRASFAEMPSWNPGESKNS